MGFLIIIFILELIIGFIVFFFVDKVGMVFFFMWELCVCLCVVQKKYVYVMFSLLSVMYFDGVVSIIEYSVYVEVFMELKCV